MDTSSVVATWLSLAATVVGLGGVISQASAINDKMDPFHANRTAEYLGIWFQRQDAFPWWVIAKPPPRGPTITAKLSEGFCGYNALHLVRVPLRPPGKASWAIILSILHPEKPRMTRCNPSCSLVKDSSIHHKDNLPSSLSTSHDFSAHKFNTRPGGSSTLKNNETDGVESAKWLSLPQRPLLRHESRACIQISRTTLITMMILTNARTAFQYSDAAGFRAGYASYNGQWYITWPIGREAVVSFAPHDSHATATDVYPSSFSQRVDFCIHMLAGIVHANASGLDTKQFQVAFCGRKAPGSYWLEYIPKGFPGAHGSRHLYNMMGGKVYDVDFMAARHKTICDERADISNATILLELPSTEKDQIVRMFLGEREQDVVKYALDCLPWSSLSWSIHRGLRDILVAFGKPTMDRYRRQLADVLRGVVEESPNLLDSRGWDPQFVRKSMGDMAVSAIMAGEGNSGDLVRVVMDIVLAAVGDWDISRLDQVSFWRRSDRDELDTQGIVALAKFFVLEWSNEFDYQLYHHLPISLFF